MLPIVSLVSAWVYGVSSPAFAVESEEHSAGEWGTPVLNHGRKWATDDLLRKKMIGVRETVTSQFNLIDQGKMTLDDYKAMGATIEHQVVGIVAQCKLPANADATFHFVIEDLLAGAATLQGRTKKEPRQGARMVITALNRYRDYFDQPGWTEIGGN
jgi:hypothetical protein